MAAVTLTSSPDKPLGNDESVSVVNDPNFAVICHFLEKFGELCGLDCPNIGDLQDMIEDKGETKQSFILFQVRLLRKLKKSVTTAKWERAFVKFAHTYSSEDGWEIERFGYKNVKAEVKLRLIKNLLEAQFDVNPKFKQEMNQKSGKDLRTQPLGCDKLGNAYWYHVDEEANLRVYKEDPDEETWEIVAQTKEELVALIGQLKSGPTYVKKVEIKVPEEEDEEDSLQGFENILRDTGPVPASEEPSAAPSNVTSVNNSDEEEDSSSEIGNKVATEKGNQADKTCPEANEKMTLTNKVTLAKPVIQEEVNMKPDLQEEVKVKPDLKGEVKTKPDEVNMKPDLKEEAKVKPDPKGEVKTKPDEGNIKDDIKKEEDSAIAQSEKVDDIGNAKKVVQQKEKMEHNEKEEKAPSNQVEKSSAPKDPITETKQKEKMEHNEKKEKAPSNQVEKSLPPKDPISETKPNENKTSTPAAFVRSEAAHTPSIPSLTDSPNQAKPESTPKNSSHYSIANLISSSNQTESHKKRPLEPHIPGESGVEQKKAKTGDEVNAGKESKSDVVTEAITDPPVLVKGVGEGAANECGNDIIEEPVMFFYGAGSGAECLARNSRVTNGNGTKAESETEDLESDIPAMKVKKPKENKNKSAPPQKKGRGRRKAESEEEEEDESESDLSEEEEQEKPASSLSKNGESRKSKKHKDDRDEEEDEESLLRYSRRSSGRIAALRIREAERRQREEEDALEEFKEKQRKKSEREKKRMAKYRKLGLDFEKEEAKRAARKKKRHEQEKEDDLSEDEGEDNEKKRRRRRKKKKNKRGEENLKEFAKFSSGSSDDDDEGLEGEEFDDHFEEVVEEDNLFKSDHEFSCESDVPDEEAQPIKHARTATKKRKKRKINEEQVAAEQEEEEEEEEEEGFACKKCDKSDHPEWILLCDKCDAGWHASCLRPTLMVIPEGNWFCPDCQHAELLLKLEENLESYEVVLKKRSAEDKRKERLAFVSLSLSNMIPKNTRSKAVEKVKKRRRRDSEASYSGSSSGSSSSSESSSSEEEPAVTKRRAARNVTYSMKEYDDMIKSAIADEVGYVKPVGNDGYGKSMDTILKAKQKDEDEEDEEEEAEEEEEESRAGIGKDMANIINAEKKEKAEEEAEAADKKEKVEDEEEPGIDKPKPLKMVIEKEVESKKGRKGKKKRKRLGDLTDSDSGDGDSGSDFVASEDSIPEDDFELEELEDDPDEYDIIAPKKSKRSFPEPTRRSSRSRKVIYDDDFVIDGSESEDEPLSKRSRGKRKRNEESWDSEMDSDDGESYGRKRKKGKGKQKGKGRGSRKKRQKDADFLDDEDTESDASFTASKKLVLGSPSRKTRGKKISFEMEEDEDSLEEEEKAKKATAAAKSKANRKKKIESSSEEEFDEAVLEDESKTSEEEDD